jgi:hypothetical protein
MLNTLMGLPTLHQYPTYFVEYSTVGKARFYVGSRIRDLRIQDTTIFRQSFRKLPSDQVPVTDSVYNETKDHGDKSQPA